MIETTIQNNEQPLLSKAAKAQKPHRVLHYQENDRMAGSVPVWKRENTSRAEVTHNISQALNNKDDETFESALAYATSETTTQDKEEPFGFGDLLDMVNPLQHIPLVGDVYRNITGDEIKPISRIMGGALFGGAAGAGTALVNVVIEEETGQDISGNVFTFFNGGNSRMAGSHKPGGSPEKRLEAVIDRSKQPDKSELPGSALAFADLGNSKQKITERYHYKDDDRMAGSVPRIYTRSIEEHMPPREPITTFSLSSEK